jgi:hypothetical protein
MVPSGSEYLGSWRDAPPQGDPPPHEKVANVILVGVRGSRESSSSPRDGMGSTLSGVADRIERRLARMQVRPERVGVRYPASSLRYRSSRDAGVRSLAGTLRSALAGRPGTRFVLLGLSQGADVVRAALQPGVLSPDMLRDLVAVVLLGDPGRDPRRDGAFQRGTPESAPGLLAKSAPPIPSGLWSRTWSYCLAGDHIAASRRGTLGVLFSGTHTHYERNAERVQDLAAEFALGCLGTAIRQVRGSPDLFGG